MIFLNRSEKSFNESLYIEKEKDKDTFYIRPYGNDQHLPCPEQLFFNENGDKIYDASFR